MNTVANTSALPRYVCYVCKRVVHVTHRILSHGWPHAAKACAECLHIVRVHGLREGERAERIVCSCHDAGGGA